MAKAPLSSVVIMLTVMAHIGRGEPGSSGRVSRCGERPAVNSTSYYGLLSRIVGGTAAKKEESPWIASLKRDGKHFCGGTIISNKHVLTAAHCVIDKNSANYLRVRVGDHDFTINERSEQAFSVKAIYKHPNFKPSKPFNYDIAILELVGQIKFDRNVQPACLPNPDDVFSAGSLCITLGWGRLKENGRLPASLQQVALPLIENRRCLSIMDTVDRRLGFETVICAGYPEGQKDACQGDSGGPFLCQRSTGRWVLVGVTSWGLGCARNWADNILHPPEKRGSPGVFTDIQRLLSWLSETLNQEKSEKRAYQVPCSTDDGFLEGMRGEILLPKGTNKYYSNNELAAVCVCMYGPIHNSDLICMARFTFSNYWLESAENYGSTNTLVSAMTTFENAFMLKPSYSTWSLEKRLGDRKCVWTVMVPKGKHILLIFNQFNLEWDHSCDLDYLVIYSALGHLIGKFCGDIRPRPLLITTTRVTLKFISDFQEYKTGFSLSYLAVEPNLYPASDCGSVAVIFEEGKIQTMNHPYPYSSYAHCQWVVHSPMYHVIKLTFLAFEIEPGEECIFDRLVVYHDLQGTVVAGMFCGFKTPDPILSVSNVMQITFTSDNYGNFKGFDAAISFVPSTTYIQPGIQWKEHQKPRKSQDTMEHFDDVCGVSPHQPRFNQPSIDKAEEAMPNSWPWHVSINFGNKHVCNGAIVSETFVLTSANCVAEREVFYNIGLVAAGLHDLESSINAQKRPVKQVITHPQYDPSTNDFDVALILLAEPFQYNYYVQPICLPDEHSKLETSDLCVVSGWNLNMELSTKLQQLAVPVLLDDICKEYYSGITDRMFCAGAQVGEDNTSCSAQSGAPLVCLSDTGIYFIFGIVSWGVGCTESPKLGVYSRVPSFIQWIKQTVHPVEGAADNDTESQHPLIPLEQLHRFQNALQPESPPSNSSSSQDIYVPCKDVMSLQSPGEIKLVASGQDNPEGVRCQLILQAPEDHFIVLTFKQLNTSHEHYSLVIYEGESSNKTFKAQVPKEKIPFIMKCTGPVVTIEATSPAQDSELQLWLSYTNHNQN